MKLTEVELHGTSAADILYLHDPQELKLYILHGLCVVNMVSVLSVSKTAYLAISKNRPLSRLKKKCYKRR